MATADGCQATASAANVRVRPAGKFLFAGHEKIWVRGVTYGAFRPDANGDEYPFDHVTENDFAAMAANGVNALRTYTLPPRRVLDCAERHGLRVMIGLPWEQHVTFLESRADSIVKRVRAMTAACAGHPAVLAYVIGNEIPSSIVRWYGKKRIERFLCRLYLAAKEADESALVTYVNYPTTEYLELPWLDLVCFNVYLECPVDLSAYLARLQNIAGERPLLLTEIGLDSRRHGENAQALSIERQVQTAFREGCAGAFVYAWTDEWHRGGRDIEDWDFGLTTRARMPKPSLAAVRRAFAEVPFAGEINWPRISVVVCSFNGARTIHDTLDALQRLDYPEYEVIVVNDGSTDDTPKIAAEYPVRLINTENRGLSSARNTGMQAASGKIVAYIDDDAYPDCDWLRFLALTFLRGDYVGVGGPNLPPAGDGEIAECVANVPGGPMHVLLTDREAEHIPGCNMAFRKEALEAIGGFDPVYRAAGDDVDICWRLQERGWKIGFSPAAMVWHHRRNSLRMFWNQQKGYGKAEALLEEKWPEKYNALGHTTWQGRLYGKGVVPRLGRFRARIYHGVWGTAPFQSLYRAQGTSWGEWFLMPEWYLVIALTMVLALFSLDWEAVSFAWGMIALTIALPLVQALASAGRVRFTSRGIRRAKLYGVTVLLHLAQPLARLVGRMQHGLTLWRRRGSPLGGTAISASPVLWREQWEAPADTLSRIYQALRAARAVVTKGDDFDDWDLEIRGGSFAGMRLLMLAEEHGAGKQLLRFRITRHLSPAAVAGFTLFASISVAAALDGAWAASTFAAILAVLVAARAWGDAAHARNLLAAILGAQGAK